MVSLEASVATRSQSDRVPAASGTPDWGEMNVRIHRGAHEIGGSCVEVEYCGSRIVLDVGKPLWAGWDRVVPLPAVPGLADGSDPSLAGVIISHPHLDHYGLIDQIHPSVPVYIGREASLLLAEAEFFSQAGVTLHPTGFLAHRVPIRVGAFTVTPYLADHSGYDSYSMLVEAGGRKLFYTGDIRGHGRKARLFEELLADPPKRIDVLLCEGTHIRADDEGEAGYGREEPARSEVDVEHSLACRMNDTEGAVLVISSAQNIDRLVTVYRACLRSGRILITDLYTASIVAAIGRESIPQPGFPSYKVYVPNRQRVQVRTAAEFDRMRLVQECRVFLEWLAEHAGEVTLLQPSSAVAELLRAGVLTDSTVVWSMWPGYLRDAIGMRLVGSLESASVPFALDHSSGHASVEDLQRLVEVLKPGVVVPIHTEGAGRFGRIFKSVAPHCDGSWWAVRGWS
jgi:ribonuclease J